MPCPGQCLNVGRGSSDIVEEIVALQADASAGLGRLHAQLQKFSAHTKPPEKSRCVAVDLSSPQAVTDQIARTSPTASEKEVRYPRTRLDLWLDFLALTHAYDPVIVEQAGTLTQLLQSPSPA